MQTDVSNVLSDLKSLSDTADQFILDSNFGNDQVGQWVKILKETAVAIAKGTYSRKSTATEKSPIFSKNDIPSLVTLIKGKQNSQRVSALLADVNKDNRVRLSHRKNRKSLRKIVLGKKSGNQWKISNRKSSKDNQDVNDTPSPKRTYDNSATKNDHGKNYFKESDSNVQKTPNADFSTPIHQGKKIVVPNTDETRPATRSKLNLAGGATEVLQSGKKTDFITPIHQSKEIIVPNTDETTPATRSKLNLGGATEVVKTGKKIDFKTPIHQGKKIVVPNTDETRPATRSKFNLAGGATEVVQSGKKINFITPIHQSKEIVVPNTDETTPATHSKSNLAGGATEVIKAGKKKVPISLQNNETIDCYTTCESTPSQFINSDSYVIKESRKSQVNEFITPENKTIIVSDSSEEKSTYVSPVTRSKRKSSIQLTQENAKKVKKAANSVTQVLSDKSSKWDDQFSKKNTFKKLKLAKDVNAVIPGILNQQNHQVEPEKRILREIQKKEEKVSQNARKLQSLQKKKIEENKKAREKKMEKAMQQRMKIEKEKEERIRSRTQSKQENLQQTELASKKSTQKKVEQVAVIKNSSKEVKYQPPQKPLRSPIKKVTAEQKSSKNNKNLEVNKTNLHNPSPQEITNTKLLNNLNATYVRSPADVPASSTPPPKPIRNAETSSEKTSKAIKRAESSAKVDVPLSSTPSSKTNPKINLTKTPVSNNVKKPNSYAMTPHESSYVSYDISEIKSDDSDEEETVNQKPIPTWAFGLNLRNTLLKQYYSSINVDELFGNFFEPPKLEKIMGMEKKHYNKRTSSAIWHESPNRSRSYQT